MTSPERRLKKAQERLQGPIQLLLIFGIIWVVVAGAVTMGILYQEEDGLRAARHWKTVIFASASAIASLAAVTGLWTGKPWGWKIANHLFACCANKIFFGFFLFVIIVITIMAAIGNQLWWALFFLAIGIVLVFMRFSARKALDTLHDPEIRDVYGINN